MVRVPFRWIAGICALAHLILVGVFGRLRAEHIVGDVLLAGLPWLGRRGHDFIRAAFPLWVTGVILDNQRIWLAYKGEVHVADLHAFELALFPAPGGVTWPEWFAKNTHPVLDLVAGLPYATYIFQYLGVAFVLYFLRRERCVTAAWIFLVANVVAAACYFFYPAAPPWYVIEHGLGPANPNAPPSPAGGLRFDALVGIDWFATLYARGPNTFGAMPSMHAAYPLITALLTWDLGRAWRVSTLFYTAAMWFGALYLQHHYVVDILAGIVIALGATWLVSAVQYRGAAGEPADARAVVGRVVPWLTPPSSSPRGRAG